MDDVRLCCPECNYCMEESEWNELKDSDGDIECPDCGEDINYDDLLSESEDETGDEEPDESDKD